MSDGVDTTKSSKSAYYRISDAMKVHRLMCPNCGVVRTFSQRAYEKVKKERIGICQNCDKAFNINVDERTGRLSFEPLKSADRNKMK